jgi:transcription elongation factor GreA
MFGSTVMMEDLQTRDVATYTLVGPYEADVQAGTISVASPLGKALIGKEEGDEIKVQTPKGVRNFEILEVQ